MNRNKLFVGITFVILSSVVLSACASATPTGIPDFKATRESIERQAAAVDEAQSAMIKGACATAIAVGATGCDFVASTPTVQAATQVSVPVVVTTVVTATSAPDMPTATVAIATQPVVGQTTSSGGWTIEWFDAADNDRGDGTTFRQAVQGWNWRKIAPELWPEFPNVPNPLVPDFRVVNGTQVPDGLEYAMNESNFCQQLAGEQCRYPVAARHYLFYSGDYSQVPQLGACKGSETTGCEMVVVNVGNVTSDHTSIFQQGFRLHARYWNGDALNMALWALMSNGASNMMNMTSNLNHAGQNNAGANCSVPEGCHSVDVRILIESGNAPLMMLTTTVTR